jgi:hypothetical protein
MTQKIAGIKVSGDSLEMVVLEQDSTGAFTLANQTTMQLQSGDRASACNILHNQLSDYLTQRKVACTCIIGSAVMPGRSATLALLHSAELRGVAMAAAAAAGDTKCVTKASIGRTLGDRKCDEYVKDEEFWDALGILGLKKGMREAAIVAVSQFKK